MSSLSRRQFHRQLAAALALPGALSLHSFAQAAESSGPNGFPARPVTLVVPYAPAGAADILGRTVALELARRWGQPVVIDNRQGASGQIGSEYVGRAKGDPYTLLLGTQAVFSVLPVLSGRKDFNIETNFTPITQLIRMPSLLLVPASLGVNTAQELIALLKAGQPGQYSFSSNGVGTSQHLIAEDFFGRIGVKGLHVPYKGSTQALTALGGGQEVTVSVDNVPSALPFIQSGRVRALAITTDTRSPQLPQVPPLAESGVPGFNNSTWMGLMAPPDIPADVQAFLSREVALALAAPAVQKVLLGQGFVTHASTPEQFRQFVRAESDALRTLVTRNNIRSE